ncbi:MAG: manganese efflux pump [Anaerovorax sp.]|nr:manganese efflux pump [Anaerovorax sp.]
MHFLSIFLFALSSDIDSFIVGMAYGIKKTQISGKDTLLISFITFIGTILSMALGKSLLNYIPIQSAGLFGGTLIICMGIYYIFVFFQNYIKERKKSEISKEQMLEANFNATSKLDKKMQKEKPSYKISHKESVILGITLSVNNMGLGIGASITGLNIFFTSIAAFVCSFFFLYLGNKIGNSRVLQTISRYAEPLSGLIIIGLGILEIYI